MISLLSVAALQLLLLLLRVMETAIWRHGTDGAAIDVAAYNE
jgi:hypothetical protein